MTLYETKSLLISAIIAKSEDIGTDVATNLSTSGIFSCLTSLPGSSSLPVMGLRGTTGALPNPPTYLAQRDHSPVWECTSLCPSLTPKPALHATVKQALPQSAQTVQRVGCLINLNRFLSVNLPLFGGLFERYPAFSPQLLQPYSCIRQRLLRKESCWDFFLPK